MHTPPDLALLIWLILLLLLLKFDPARTPGTSPALWLPVTWIFILASRNPSQWLSGIGGALSAKSIQKGNPLDEAVFLFLILTSIWVLSRRSIDWKSLFEHNAVLMAFVIFALLSVCWSGFPFITFKRWFRDLGSYLAMLVVVSDVRPIEATRTLLRRLTYLLVPLSIVLIKYFPALSNSYDPWTGVGTVGGVATSKNMLGTIFLACGIFIFWDSLARWPDRTNRQVRQTLIVNAVFAGMILWLVHITKSTTSEVCLILGCLVLGATRINFFRRHRTLLKMLVPFAFLLYLLLDFGLGLNGKMAEAVGKNPNLTDRTLIWAFLLKMHTNPLIGTGYQSFWVGPRLQYFWNNAGLGHINEAHNGYLEIYLELGLIGVILMAIFLISALRAISRNIDTGSQLGVLGLALWLVIVFYNMSEAAFEGGLLYTIFLITAVRIPARNRMKLRRISPLEHTEAQTADTAPAA